MFEILLILFLTVLNGVFATAEMAIVSARKARLQQRADAGDARAGVALELATAPERLLSTVQVGITLVGIVAGAFGGAALSEPLAKILARSAALAPYSAALAFGIVVAAITYLSLVIGELVPKRLALGNAEGIAIAIAKPMRALSVAASPIVWLLSVSSNGLMRLLGIKPSTEPPVTEEEINILIGQGVGAGVFEEAERNIVERVFRLGDRRAAHFMTPRTEVVWLDVDDPAEANRRKIVDSGHYTFPVCQGSLDNVLGVASIKHLWAAQAADSGPPDLRAAIRKPLFVLETLRVWKLLERFRENGTHVALVVDEFGGVSGLITVHDLLDAMVGDISTPETPEDRPIVRREDGSWLLDGMLSVDEFREALDLGKLPDEDAGHYTTLGGFVMTRLGHVPMVSDHFDWNGLRFEVIDMDGHRVDKVLAAPLA